MNTRLFGTGAMAFALASAAVLGSLPQGSNWTSFVGAAWADDGQGGPDNSQGNQGGQGQGSKGSQSGQDQQGGSGSGQGGPDDSSDSKGPQAGSPSSSGTGGGKPAWAQEGIPEVELGRLSVVRAPQLVLDRSLAEAILSYDSDMADLYNLPLYETTPDPALDTILERLASDWDNVTLYDSPLQNLGLLQELYYTGDVSIPVTNSDMTLMAVFLGVASDKLVEVTPETVEAILTIFDARVPDADADGEPDFVPVNTLSDSEMQTLAAMAEDVRFAVYVGHEG